ncbi:carnitine/acyl carnitine carrier protein [Ceratobasidium sp. AG-Ba]|nr:carnitine/acyl carnitine carrier protein [Ceratobasidium sp. AG-Ba]
MRWQAIITALVAGTVLAEPNGVQHTLPNAEQHTPSDVRTASANDPAFRKTLVDVLSGDKDYTLLLKALQRARLVPTLNRISQSTLFAPTNDAIKRYAERHPDSAWAELVDDKEGNPHVALREHLFYHLLNYTATPTTPDSLPVAPATYTHRTLHFPRAPDNGSAPPSHEPPDSPPWMPLPGGLLAGEPQRLRITWRDDAAWVAVGANAEDGVKVAKEDVEASNGRVVGVSEVLRLPHNLARVVRHHPKLQTLSRYITSDIERTLANTPHLTLFVPDDSAWDALKPMERLWLDSGYADRDLMDIFARHATVGEKPHEAFANDEIKVGWSENWGSDTAFQSLTSTTLRVQTNSDGLSTINDGAATILAKDVYASNGVLHTVDSLLVPPGSPLFKATAEKWLLALNATVFVGMLREAGLSSYVDGTNGENKQWTILAPADDVLTDITSLRARVQHLNGIELNARDQSTLDTIQQELRTLLRYHIVPGILESKDLVDGQLIGTELRPDSLKGERMRLKVDVVNGKTGEGQVGALGNGDLAFGGANVIAEPVRVDNTIIYLISRPLTLPPEALTAALSSLSHTTFTSLLYTSGLSVNRPATTLLVPVNDGFTARGLAVKWLMMDEPEARQGLRKVLMHHLIEGIVVGRDLWVGEGDGGKGGKGKKSWSTVEGSDVRVVAGEGDSLLIEASGSDESPLPLTILDTLTRTGVLHEVAGVLWPRSVRVGLRELGQAADGGTMLRLVQRAGMEGVWNGSGVPVEKVLGSDLGTSGSGLLRWLGLGDNLGQARSEKGKGDQWSYTLLCPTDAAFARINLTRLLDDRDALKAFVRQHIIPIPFINDDKAGTKSFTPGWADRVIGRFVGQERGVENLMNGEYAAIPSQGRYSPTGRVLSQRYTTSASPYEPDAETPLPLKSASNRFSTLLTPHSAYGDVVFTYTGDRGWAVGVKGADAWAHVTSWGRTVGVGPAASVYADSDVPVGGGVVQIDRVLEPYAPAWWREWGAAFGVGAAGIALIGLLFSGVAWIWKRDVQEATYEPADGGDDE